MINKFIILIALFTTSSVIAQSELEITPKNISFESEFNRLENVRFVNNSEDEITIDTISYQKDLYLVRFDREWEYPLTVAPGDTVLMDCFLVNHFYVRQSDTADNMKVYYSNYSQTQEIKIDIGFYNEEIKFGTISGNVMNNGEPLKNAAVQFYYEGSYVLDTAVTNSKGYYSKQVYQGDYKIAVRKEGYNLTFYDSVSSPHQAEFVNAKADSSVNINFSVSQTEQTSYSLTGSLFNYRSNAKVKKGVVVVRKGTHTPTKVVSNQRRFTNTDSTKIYSTLVNNDGTFEINNLQEPGYYVVQAFSDFYMPGYYSGNNEWTPYWQNADSILVNGSTTEADIFVKRDSSYGGGTIEGKVNIQNSGGSSNNSGTIVFAQNANNDELYFYTITGKDGSYMLNNLPYGEYILIAQKAGFEDGISENITIDSSTTEHKNVNISLNVTRLVTDSQKPDDFQLHQNYPNPFNPKTNIKFSVPSFDNRVKIKTKLTIYDILGNKIAVPLNKNLRPGTYTITFNAKDLASGIYLYRLSAGGFIDTKKFILVK
jgi:hypothetical protein